MSFLQDVHPLHPNHQQAGVDADQQLCPEELPAEQSRGYSLGEQGMGDAVMQTPVLVLCYSLNTYTSATTPIWTYPKIFWQEKECCF